MRKLGLAALLTAFWGGLVFAQDLTIDYRYNVSGVKDGNYLSYRSAIRYIAADKDAFDAVSGASKQKSTSLFAPIQTDIMGRATISSGFRGLLLFPLAPDTIRTDDNLHIYREGPVITMEYVHRGVAYRIQTDRSGNIGFPRGSYVMRTVGYIQGEGPQVISRDFARDMTAATIDWKKVWDPGVPSGQIVAAGNDAKTGPIQNDYGDMMAMFNWDGTLEVKFEAPILTIQGVLRPVKR
ncbi:hypothetical protein LQZ21_05440 [Treponema sp. TIM-1]|uniref:hypothetical protein n=1 Tax=Treponema sp. TIM-1 TaxID=2898417 RepID=UPI00397F3390